MFRPSFGITAILAALLLCQCSDKATGPDQVKLGEAFTLTAGSTVEVQGKNLSLRFQKVLDDSRCPANLECYWQGVAEIEVVLRSKTGDSATMTLGVLGGTTDIVEQPFFVDALGYRLSLLRLEPYPAQSMSSSTSDARLAQGQSRATLRLEQVTASNHPIGSVEITDTPLDSILLDYFYIDSVAVEGDTLRVAAHYSGCCKEHYFFLFMSPGSFLESNPVQVDLCLRHYANHDVCECLEYHDLQFDLSPIADLCLQTYGAPKPIVLNISEFTNSVTDRSFRVEYVPAGAQRNRPPVLSSVGSQTVRERDTLQFAVSATDPDGTIPIMSTEGLPSNASFVDNGTGIGTFLFLPEASQAGDYQIAFVASDGMLADTETVAVHVEEYINHAPVMTEIGPQSVEIGDTLRFVVAATDPDGSIPVIMAENLPGNASLMTTDSNGSAFWFAPDTTQVGVHGVLFYATDGELADSEMVSITVTTPNLYVPTLEPIETIYDSAGSIVSLAVLASDDDGTISVLTALNLPEHALFVDSGNGRGGFAFASDTSQHGTFVITFVAADGLYADSEEVTIILYSQEMMSSALIPMAVGNYWVYSGNWYVQTMADSIEIVSTSVVEGMLWWNINDAIWPGHWLGQHFRLSGDSIYNENGLQFIPAGDTAIIFPAAPGIHPYQSVERPRRVFRRADSVVVPSGTFYNCVQYDCSWGSGFYHSYELAIIAPDVGVILMEWYYELGLSEGKGKIVLERYRVR